MLKLRNIVLALGLVGAAAQSQAVEYYSLTALWGGGSQWNFENAAQHINNAGQIYGVDRNTLTMTSGNYFPTPSGYAVARIAGENNTGTVIGNADSGNPWYTTEGFIWKNGQMTTLGANSSVGAINHRGQVAGYVNGGQGATWVNGQMSLLPSLPSKFDVRSIPTAINNSGQIAGYTQSGSTHATLWSDGKAIDLTPNLTPAGEQNAARFSSIAWDMNNKGAVVGVIQDANTSWSDAVLWQNGTQTLLSNPGGKRSYASAINEAGLIVGYAGSRGVLWMGNKQIDLNYVLDQKDRAAGWVISTAWDINDKGYIVGSAWKDGQAYAVLLNPISPIVSPVPEPESYAAMLAGFAMFGLMARAKKKARA